MNNTFKISQQEQESGMLNIFSHFEQNNQYLTQVNTKIQTLTYESNLLEKESINILLGLKRCPLIPITLLEKLYNLSKADETTLSPEQKEDFLSAQNWIIELFFSEVNLSPEEISSIKIVGVSTLNGDAGALAYYIYFIVPRFSDTQKIIVSIPTYNVSLRIHQSFLYKIGTIAEGDNNINFVTEAAFLSDILQVLANTFGGGDESDAKAQ